MKKCKVCGTICHKTKDYFPTQPDTCKHCYKVIQYLYSKNLINRIRTGGYDRQYKESDIEVIKEYRLKRIKKKGLSKTKGLKNKIKRRLSLSELKHYCYRCNKLYDKQTQPEYILWRSICHDCHKGINRKHQKIYLQDPENKLKANKRTKDYIKKRLKEDSFFKFQMSIRSLITISIKNKGYTRKSRATQILGCDWETFKLHIEKQFKKGMSWENRSEWHIDHIYPMKEAKTEEDVIRLNHYTNLRPLWAKENLSKNASIEEHQMKLPI